MRYAYFPGCVAKSSAPELYESTAQVTSKLGIELEELVAATCCGTGAVNEGNPFLNILLNARTFAMAEDKGLDILTICSTCQGVFQQTKWQLDNDPTLKTRTNEALEKIGMHYEGNLRIKHLLWALIEDYGLSRLSEQVAKPLSGMKISPFYGCYILRPPEVVKFESHEKPNSLEKLIAVLGGEVVHYEGETKCCGFPILFVQRDTAFEMTAAYINNAQNKNAHFMVTPCPLCHISLDTYQKKSAKHADVDLNVPVMHLPQMVGLALGIPLEKLGFSKHMVSMTQVLHGL